MLVSKCFSILMSSIILVNSTAAWYCAMPSNNIVEEAIPVVKVITEEPVIEPIIEEVVIEEPAVEEIAKKPKVEEVIIEEPVVEEIIKKPQVETLSLTDEEIDLIALITMAEAEDEPEEGKQLVIDVILNRVDSPRFSDTVHEVVYAKNVFECLQNGRINKCYVRDDIRQLVIEELQSRTNSNIHYFRADRYHSFGKPVTHVGNHYFSTY